jgi:hypothetical protein
MSKYVSRAVAMRNGSRVPDIKSVVLDEVVFRGETMTMDGPGTFEVGKKYTFSFDQVIRKGASHTDWESASGENWSFELNGGTRVDYVNCDCISEGEIKMDFEKETVQTIKFHGELRSFR